MGTVTAALIALAVFVGTFSLLDLVFSEERAVKRRLARLSEYEASQAREVEPLLSSFFDRVVRPALKSFSEISRALAPGGYRAGLKVKIERAGSPRGLDVDRLLAAKSLTALGVLVGFGTIGMLGSLPVGRVLLLLLVIVPLSFYLPDLWLRGQVSKRQTAIRRALPDMLDMLTVSVEAGLGFDAAVAKLVRNSPGPLSIEFAKMLKEVQAGIPRQEALRNLSKRLDVPELNAFVMAMVQADIFGISIANVLRVQANEMRTRRRQFAEESAQKAPVKLVFPLIFCILPATLIVILGPAMVSIGRALGLLSS